MRLLFNNLTKLATTLALLTALAATLTFPVKAEIANPGNYEKLRQETVLNIKSRLAPLLSQYCKDACLIVDIKVDIDEQLTESEDIGFEGVAGDDLGKNLYVSKIIAEIQVDDRVTSVNRDRLLTILKNNLQTITSTVDILWRPVTLPQIGQSGAVEEELKHGLEQKISAAVEKVIETYCPEECVLSEVAVDGKLVTPDEAAAVPAEGVVHDKSGNAILRIENVDVEVAMDVSLDQATRTKITNIMKAKTRFATPVNLNVQASAFPESYARKQEKEQKKSDDPFGLQKLRETLKIFHDLAGTKEIITSNTSKQESNTNAKESSAKESAEKRDSSTAGMEPWQWALAIGGLLLLLGIIAFVVMRFASANRDAHLMMMEADQGSSRRGAGHEMGAAPNKGGADAKGVLTDGQRREMTLRVKNEELRDELIKTFLDQPRVAKETFSRLLQEEGVEETARYVHIFGHLVIFELLADPNLQRDLYELTEFYNKSQFDFTPEEEHKHLTALKTRVTASEIRVLTRKQMDKFDFLLKLDATQIYNLIAEEKPQVQSIVLTQLDHKRRRAVFDLYAGQAKIDMMRELCRADAIPKEFLSNVAKALHQKVTSRPEFDTENLRASDILLDLLEKAELAEQRGLMSNLTATNPEAARAIKLKLVTVEIMPYLKDGHLLEIIMGMEREDLLTFLAATREHIRALLLSKAPEELADSWIEDLNNFKAASEQNYRLVEMKVLGRIRNLANNGAINLLDINDMIFGKGVEPESVSNDQPISQQIASPSSMVA